MTFRDFLVMALAGLILIAIITSYARTAYHYSWDKIGYIAVGGLVVETGWCALLFAVYIVGSFSQ